MTLLVFLASLVILDRILRRAETRPGPSSQIGNPDETKSEIPGLFELGRTLEEYGCGQSPTSAPGPVKETEPVRQSDVSEP